MQREDFNYPNLIASSSNDVRNLKLASRVFVSSPLSQQFWASRFQRDFEFSFIFEVRKVLENNSRPRDWKLLYDGIKKSLTKKSPQNRRRIWRLVLSLADKLAAIEDSCLKGDPAPTFYERDFTEDNNHWRYAGGSTSEDAQPLYSGCRVLHSRTIHITERITGVYVSFIEMHDAAKYMTGIRFIQHDRVVIELGRIFKDHEIYLSVEGNVNRAISSTRLQGFHLAVRESGIQAIAMVLDFGELSAWAGSHKGLPRRQLLASDQPVQKLHRYFDVSNLHPPVFTC